MYVDIHRYVVRVWGKVDVFSVQKRSLPIDQIYTYISCFPFWPTYVKSKGIKPLLLKILLLSTKVYTEEFGNWGKFSYIYSKLTLMKKSQLRNIIKEEIESISGDFYALVKNDRNKISIIGVGTKDQVNNKKKELESRNKGRNYSVAYTLNIHKAPKL